MCGQAGDAARDGVGEAFPIADHLRRSASFRDGLCGVATSRGPEIGTPSISPTLGNGAARV